MFDHKQTLLCVKNKISINKIYKDKKKGKIVSSITGRLLTIQLYKVFYNYEFNIWKCAKKIATHQKDEGKPQQNNADVQIH